MDVNKTDVVAPVGSGGPKKEEKRGTDEEQREKNHDTEAEASGASPWEGTEAFAVDGLLAGVLTPEVQQAFDSLARQIEPLRPRSSAPRAARPISRSWRKSIHSCRCRGAGNSAAN